MGAAFCKPKPIDFEGEVDLFHFNLQRVVGKGAFGKVRVVEHKQTHDVYALKYISKERCAKKNSVSNIIQERRLLEEINHPFVVNMRYAFQDDENCFFVLDLMLGGDLRFHLERMGPIPENNVRFYMAQLASALCYLHQLRIVHRDVKPANILLDCHGNAHLSDFNVASHIDDLNPKATTVGGTLPYMAPESLTGTYNESVDWWSLGVSAYELIFGCRPYAPRSTSELRKMILKDSLRWPDGGDTRCTAAGKMVLQGLLQRDPNQRLACKPNGVGFRELQSHPWFECIDWDTLDKKEQPAPFIPDSKKFNFDITHELEDVMRGGDPLRAKERKSTEQAALTAEMQQMETQFTTYDFRKMAPTRL